MQKPDAIPLAAPENRLNFPAAKPVDFGLAYTFFDPVEALKPLGMPGHEANCSCSVPPVYPIWQSSVTSSTKRSSFRA
jgi:hypothetical protein